AEPSAAARLAAEAWLRGLLHWLRDESFIGVVAEWSWDWCLEFPKERVKPEEVEHSLHFTAAHTQYRELFEARAQEYQEHQGGATDGMLRSVMELLHSCPGEAWVEELLEGLSASEDYHCFFNYMSAVRRRREWAERSMCGSRDEINWPELVRTSLRRDLGDVTVGDESDVESIE
ncbi:unnamed protein product, partial [Prorocentrum cordatum]